MTFPTGCYACNAEGETRMCTCSIPFFKEIIIMAFTCDKCGYRTSDVKNGGGISEKGTKITFSVTEEADINRDIFKSDTCCFEIPELDFSMDIGTLGSMYTTVEGFI
jgi:zinc finger protein